MNGIITQLIPVEIRFFVFLAEAWEGSFEDKRKKVKKEQLLFNDQV